MIKYPKEKGMVVMSSEKTKYQKYIDDYHGHNVHIFTSFRAFLFINEPINFIKFKIFDACFPTYPHSMSFF